MKQLIQIGVGEQGADQGQGGRHEGRARDPEHRPRRDEGARRAGERRDHRGDGERRAADQEQAPPPDAVAERAHGDQEPGDHEAVDVHRPELLGRAQVEVGAHRGERQVEHAHVEREQQGRQGEDREADPGAPWGRGHGPTVAQEILEVN
jgi:hypothetical protein